MAFANTKSILSGLELPWGHFYKCFKYSQGPTLAPNSKLLLLRIRARIPNHVIALCIESIRLKTYLALSKESVLIPESRRKISWLVWKFSFLFLGFSMDMVGGNWFVRQDTNVKALALRSLHNNNFVSFYSLS